MTSTTRTDNVAERERVEPIRVAVAGATGYLGGHVVRELRRQGFWVRSLTRDAARLEAKGVDSDEVFVGQATQADSLRGFCDGCQVVYSGLGIRSAKRRPNVWDVDYRANLNVLELAQQAGAEHFIFVTAVHSDRLRERGVDIAEARERVVDTARASGLRWTVFRATSFFSDAEEFFKLAKKGTGWVIGDGGMPINPIHGADLAAEVVSAIEDESAWNRALSRGGPDVLTLREIYELAFEALGKKPRIRRVPRWLLATARHCVRPFNGTLAGFLHAIQVATRMDMSAPPCGTHHLRDFYAELASEE